MNRCLRAKQSRHAVFWGIVFFIEAAFCKPIFLDDAGIKFSAWAIKFCRSRYLFGMIVF